MLPLPAFARSFFAPSTARTAQNVRGISYRARQPALDSLTDICNQVKDPPPAPPAASQIPPKAATIEPDDAPRASGPSDTALDVLSQQVHAVLDASRNVSPAWFGKAIDALALDPKQPLTRKQASALVRTLKRLPVPPRHKEQRNALYDLARATRAEAMLHEQIARHAARERNNQLPGSQRSVGTGGMIGIKVGLPAAIDAGVAVGGRQENSVSTFDDMTIATLRSATVMGDASAQATVLPGVGVDARVSGFSTHSDTEIWLSMRERVLSLAHASVARRLGGNAAQRAFKRMTTSRRDRYDERVTRALALQATLPVLMGSPAFRSTLPALPGAEQKPQPLVFGFREQRLDAVMTTHGGTLGANAGYGVGQLGLAGTATRIELKAALPTRLTELGTGGLPPSQDPQILRVLEARIARLLESAQPHSPALLLRDASRRPDDLALRLKGVAQVRGEFDRLQFLDDLSRRHPAQARPLLASLGRDWGSGSSEREPVMIALLDSLAWLQATPPPEPASAGQLADWTRLQRTAQAQARHIHETSMPHDRARVHRATHAFREQTQRIATSSGRLSISAAVPLLNATGAATVARHVRQDPDPLRDGTYLELTLSASLGTALGPLLSELERRMPEWGALPVREAEALIAPLTADLTLTGTAQIMVRFFRPSFQLDPDFPTAARGNHLHAVRVATGTTQSLGLTVPVPALPGLSPTLSVQHSRAAQHTRYDRLGEGTLTSALMRYNSLCSETEPRAQTWANLLDSHGPDLDRLAIALADPRSVPAQESRYWLQRAPATISGAAPTRRDNADTRTLDAFKQPADRDTRRAQLHALFAAVGAITSRQKATSPLIGALTLHATG